MEHINFGVRVICSTYNHFSYIEKAMDGFCMQQTSFPFLCIITEDCSTDGEQDIIKTYLTNHFIPYVDDNVKSAETDDYLFAFARHETNKNCFFAVFLFKYNHYSQKISRSRYYQKWQLFTSAKYVAMCEGDDYWMHPNKLQQQVSFLENHPDYSMSFHKCLCESGRNFYSFPSKTTLTAKDIILHHIIPTSSLVYKSCCTKHFKYFKIGFGDIPLEIQLAMRGKVYFIPQEMSVYRDNNPTSITHTKGQGWKGLKGSVLVYYYLLKNYPFNKYSIFLAYKLFRAAILFPLNYIRLKRSGRL